MTNIMLRREASSNTDREISGFWGDCPFDKILLRGGGVHFEEDFIAPGYTTAITATAAWGQWKAFGSTGATHLPATPAWGGIATLGSDGDDEGAVIQGVGLPFQISRSHNKLWFECRVKFDTIQDTKYDAFIGLGDQMTISATVPITATAGTMADENWVGFHRLGTDGDYVDFRYKADGVTAVTVGSDAQVLVADTWVKLGFVYDPVSYGLTYYGNGQPLGTYTVPSAAGTDFPNDVLLSPLAAVINAAVVTSVFSIDWIRCYQLNP